MTTCTYCHRARESSAAVRTLVVWLLDGESTVISPEEKGFTVCVSGWDADDPNPACPEALFLARRIVAGCPETKGGRLHAAVLVFTDTTSVRVLNTEGDA